MFKEISGLHAVIENEFGGQKKESLLTNTDKIVHLLVEKTPWFVEMRDIASELGINGRNFQERLRPVIAYSRKKLPPGIEIYSLHGLGMYRIDFEREEGERILPPHRWEKIRDQGADVPDHIKKEWMVCNEAEVKGSSFHPLLSSVELEILDFLVVNNGRVVKYQDMYRLVTGRLKSKVGESDKNLFRRDMCEIKNKIEENDIRLEIVTHRSLGYELVYR